MDHRDPGRDRCVVQQVAGLEGVGAVEDDVVAVDEPSDVVGQEHLVVGHDLDVGVERLDRLAGGVDLLRAEALGRMDDLALQVARLDDVEVDDAERPNAGRGEVQGARAAEAAGADEQHLRLEQLHLPGGADLRDQEVPAVARLLGRGEGRRRLDRQAVCLPREDAAGHVGDVRVAQLLELLGAEAGAGAASAVQDDLGGLVGDGRFDLLLELAARDEQGARDMAGVPLDLLADVDQLRTGGVPGLGFRRADLADGGLHQSSGLL